MGNGNTPAVPQTPNCPKGTRCHVTGKGLVEFGKKFPQTLVKELASSSVVLVVKEEGKADRLVASGTLIHPHVVLCASHTLNNLSARNIEILMFYECSKRTAPPGARYQYRDKNKWLNCTKINSTPQAKAIRVIENGQSNKYDYALLGIKWKTNTVTFPAGRHLGINRPT